jgi:hypothetical protein
MYTQGVQKSIEMSLKRPAGFGAEPLPACVCEGTTSGFTSTLPYSVLSCFPTTPRRAPSVRLGPLGNSSPEFWDDDHSITDLKLKRRPQVAYRYVSIVKLTMMVGAYSDHV